MSGIQAPVRAPAPRPLRLSADGLETRRWDGTKSAFANYAAAMVCPPTGDDTSAFTRSVAGLASAGATPLSRYGRGTAAQRQGEGAAASDAHHDHPIPSPSWSSSGGGGAARSWSASQRAITATT